MTAFVAVSIVTAPRARFVYCPDNITVVSNTRQGVPVWWRNPLSDVIVSSPPVMVSQNTSPGGLFLTGVTEVVYRTENADGVTVYCRFHVHVVSLRVYLTPLINLYVTFE